MLNFVISEIEMNKISNIVSTDKLLTSDGAWGTYLFDKGLISGMCPEEWNLTHFKEVFEIATKLLTAGSDIISTNSFGANKFKLMEYNLDDQLNEICTNQLHRFPVRLWV